MKKRQVKIPIALRMPKMPVKWYPDERKYLLENYRVKSNPQLLAGINELRGPHEQILLGAIRHELARLGCKRMKRPEQWTKKQTVFLRGAYKLMGDVEIADHLNALRKKQGRRFTKKRVWKKRKLLNLHRTPAQVDRIRSDSALCGVYSTADKMWDTIGRTADGEISIVKSGNRQVKRIKINGAFIPYARWYYQNFIGKIPAGKAVWHKDGNSLNDDPDNLILVTREERVKLLHELRRNASKKSSYLQVKSEPGELFNARDWAASY